MKPRCWSPASGVTTSTVRLKMPSLSCGSATRIMGEPRSAARSSADQPSSRTKTKARLFMTISYDSRLSGHGVSSACQCVARGLQPRQPTRSTPDRSPERWLRARDRAAARSVRRDASCRQLRARTCRRGDGAQPTRYACNLADRLDLRGEDVAGAALGADERRLALVGLDLPAQPPDLDVDGAVVDLVVVQAGQAEELVARQHPLRGREERGQEVEFVVGQADHRAAGRGEAPQAHVELPAGEAV